MLAKEKHTVVGRITLDKTPTVDVDDHALLTVVATQKIKTADALSEALAYLRGP